MSTRTVTQLQPPAHKSRARALSLTLVAASKPAPLLDIPAELGLEILELGLTHTPFSTLAAVSKAFSALIANILYRHVVLDSAETLSLFYWTAKSKSPAFLDAHIKTLTVTIEPWRFTSAARIELESIIAACTGLRALSVPRPGILGQPLDHHQIYRTLPSELTIQSFEASEWECPSTGAAVFAPSSPAAHLSPSITHLRISEPGDRWYSPLSILMFFGSTPHLTHLALARRMDANIDNDQVFVDEVSALLASRTNLRMLVVRIFPAQWPRYFDHTVSAESSSIWAALTSVAEVDKRLILVPAGWEACADADAVSWAHVPSKHAGGRSGFNDFWKRSRAEWEARNREDLEQ
ncbi:hypothetical protein B0H19DRAFT_1090426 [Mycena capillaripes]|nr:hypothetical protein B0H19DRAFT_1090426 [Mycena capillaripes]